jgi:hypothetical protein
MVAGSWEIAERKEIVVAVERIIHYLTPPIRITLR